MGATPTEDYSWLWGGGKDPWTQDIEQQKKNEEGATASPSASQPNSRQAWGFTSPTGGKGTLGYTPQDWGGGYDYLEGFDTSKLDLGHPDADSMKYVFARATQGLTPGASSIDEIIRRLAEQGINAKRAGADSIDFGLGEGPMDVIRGGTDATGYHGFQWIPGAGGAGGGDGPVRNGPRARGRAARRADRIAYRQRAARRLAR